MNAIPISAVRRLLGLAPLAALPVILWPGQLQPWLILTLIGIAVVGLAFVGLHFLPRRERTNRSRDPILDALNTQKQSTSFMRQVVWVAGLILSFVSAWYVLKQLGYWNEWTKSVLWIVLAFAVTSSPPRLRSTKRGFGRRHHP